MSATALATALTAIGSCVGFFAFYRLNKKIKKNESDSIEINNLKDIINTLRLDRDSLISRIERLEKRDMNRERVLIEIEAENNIYKRAGAAGLTCEIERSECPIYVKFNQLKK